MKEAGGKMPDTKVGVKVPVSLAGSTAYFRFTACCFEGFCITPWDYTLEE